MSNGFYQLNRKDEELVMSGKIAIEELGFRDALAMRVNPTNGYCLANFSVLAEEWNVKPARVKYAFKKLKDLGLIYYEVCQGKRSKSYFFVVGLEMTKTSEKKRIVTPEYMEKAADFSEVKIHFQKLKVLGCIGESYTAGSQDSEVTYIDTDIEKEIETKKEKEKEETTVGFSQSLKSSAPKGTAPHIVDVSKKVITYVPNPTDIKAGGSEVPDYDSEAMKKSREGWKSLLRSTKCKPTTTNCNTEATTGNNQ